MNSAVLGETWVGGTGDVDVCGVCWSGASFQLVGMKPELTMTIFLRPPSCWMWGEPAGCPVELDLYQKDGVFSHQQVAHL